MADQGMNTGSQSPMTGGMQSNGATPQYSSSDAGNGMPGLSSTVQSAKDTAANLAGQAKQYAGDMTIRAKDKSRSMFEQQKEAAVGQLDTVAQALHRTAEELQQSANPQVAQYIDMAATKIESLGGRLREKDLDTLLNDTQNLARRNPGIFLAGTVAAGFLIARFLKSSSERHLSLPAPDRSATVGTMPGSGTYAGSQTNTAPSPGGSSGQTQHVAGTSTDTAGAMTGDLDVSSTGDKSSPVTPAATSATITDGSNSTSSSRRTNQGGNFHGDR